MRARRLTVALTAAVVAGLSACERPGTPEAPGPETGDFSYAATSDLSGYYVPASEVRVGNWRLAHVFVGQAAQFRSWAEGERPGTLAPVTLQFEDAASPTAARVRPTRYAVWDDRVRFEGASPELGRVAFDGRLDPGALATARRNLGDEGVVLTGTLTADGQTVRNVRLRWWMGD